MEKCDNDNNNNNAGIFCTCTCNWLKLPVFLVAKILSGIPYPSVRPFWSFGKRKKSDMGAQQTNFYNGLTK